MQKYQQLLRQIQSAQLQTPFYCYDLTILENRFQNLKQSLPENFKINYSMKANPNIFVLEKMRTLSRYVDVSSIGEIQIALKAGYLFADMSFVGPGKSSEELHFAILNNIGCLIVESVDELELISQICNQLNQKVKYCLRINPDQLVSDNGKVVEKKPSQFGIDLDQIIHFKKYMNNSALLDFSGLHFYLQSQLLNSQSILANFKIYIEAFKKIQSELNVKLKMINFGGGFGIPYFDGQSDLNLSQFKSDVENLIQNNPELNLNDVEMFVESGRFLMGPSGVFVTKILYRKTSQDKNYLICDGGFTQNMAATGVGQIVRRNYKAHSLSEHPNAEIESVTIAGPSCYAVDILATDIKLNKVKVGDYIVIENSGSYGKSFSPESFLSRSVSNEFIGDIK